MCAPAQFSSKMLKKNGSYDDALASAGGAVQHELDNISAMTPNRTPWYVDNRADYAMSCTGLELCAFFFCG